MQYVSNFIAKIHEKNVFLIKMLYIDKDQNNKTTLYEKPTNQKTSYLHD